MNEITIKFPPRISGKENQREYEKVTTELALAKARHPNVCKDYAWGNDDAHYFECEAEEAKKNNDALGTDAHGYGILMEEVLEAFEACAKYDWKNAYTEFAQVAAVAIRLMEKVRKEHLERKDGEE